MALSGSRLQGVLDPALVAQFLAQMPVNPGLLPAEQAASNAGRQKLATAIATAVGPNTVTEITGHAIVPANIVGTVTSGPGSGGATNTTATGTVT